MVIYALGFFVYDITWCTYIMGIMDHILMGGLILLFIYHHLCMYFIVLVMYVHVVFDFFPSFYIWYAYFFVHISPRFTLSQLCEIYP